MRKEVKDSTQNNKRDSPTAGSYAHQKVQFCLRDRDRQIFESRIEKQEDEAVNTDFQGYETTRSKIKRIKDICLLLK